MSWIDFEDGHGLEDLADVQRQWAELERLLTEHLRMSAIYSDPLEAEVVLEDVLDAEYVEDKQ